MKMIRINDTYGIEVEDRTYTLVQISKVKTGKNAGKEAKKSIGYYGSLISALNGCRKKMISDSLEIGSEKTINLDEAIKIVKDVNSKFEKFIKETFKKVNI